MTLRNCNRIKPKNIIFYIILIGLFLRIGYVITLKEDLKFPDSYRYDALGLSILEGKGYPTIATAPAYPFFLSAVYFIFGHSFKIVWIVQSILDCVSAFILYKIGSKIISKDVGIIAGFLYCWDPFLIFFCGLLLTETVFITVLLGFILCLILLSRPSSMIIALVCGILFAAGVLIKPVLLYLGFALILISICRGLVHRTKTYYYIIVLLVAGAGLSPWIIRNYIRYNRFIIATGGGIILLESNNPNATGGAGQNNIPGIQYIYQIKDEIERDNYCKMRAKEFIINNPGKVLRLAVEKQKRFWAVVPRAKDYQDLKFRIISFLWTVPVYICAIMGFWKTKNKFKDLFPIWFPILFFTLLHTIILGSIRYRLPIMPYIHLYAAAGICFIKEITSREK